MHLTSLILGILLSATSYTSAKKSKADSAVLLSKVKSLTLHGDRQTSSRRVSPIPQLTCVGGAGCKHYNVDLMRCQNAGAEYDAEDIQWTCSASLPPDFKLGSTEVACEGYDNADDPWVLKGSCGVEYRLLLTEEGERKYANPKSAYKPKYDDYSEDYKAGHSSPQSAIVKLLFWVAFVGVLCFILYRIFIAPVDGPSLGQNDNNRPGWGGGGGGGGYDNGFDDPPPPYSPQPPRPKASSSRSSRNTGTQSGPGFWSGAAAGAAGGYGAGYFHGSRTSEAERRQQERERERSRERRRERERSSSSWFGGGGGRGSFSGFGGGGGGAGGGSSTPSSSRHESTGFGGSRRR